MNLKTKSFLLVFFLSWQVQADDTITWVHPTQYTDSSALSLADIEATVIRWYPSATSTVVESSARVAAPATSVVLPRSTTVAGTRCYQAATRMLPAAGGQQSAFAPSARVCKTIAAPVAKKPKPPTGLTTQ